MRTAIVIPARYASTRLPGKPLLNETGKYLIQHVFEQACKAECAGDVIIATDDERIFSAVRSFGGRPIMTRAEHASGTDRVAEVAAHLAADVIINLQGDEPQIEPESIDRLAELMHNPAADVATLAVNITEPASYFDPNVVKVVCDDEGRALYFSRAAIPMIRDGEPDFTVRPSRFLQHLGVYAYRKNFLLKFAATPPHPLELAEKLEQLRVLGTGGIIHVAQQAKPHRGIDTPEDYAEFVKWYRAGGGRAAIDALRAA